jgi:hypothetical protein
MKTVVTGVDYRTMTIDRRHTGTDTMRYSQGQRSKQRQRGFLSESFDLLYAIWRSVSEYFIIFVGWLQHADLTLSQFVTDVYIVMQQQIRRKLSKCIK